MGSGKTAVGRRVGARLGMPFVDLDEVVVHDAGKSIAAIFRDAGEAGFRRLESVALYSVLRVSGQVIAPGGGALQADENWRRARDDNLVVFLNASPRALRRRARRGAAGWARPLWD